MKTISSHLKGEGISERNLKIGLNKCEKWKLSAKHLWPLSFVKNEVLKLWEIFAQKNRIATHWKKENPWSVTVKQFSLTLQDDYLGHI